MKLNISDDLKLPIEAVTQTFAVLAKRGVGKTYTACVMVEEMLSASQQVVIADPIGVWWGLRSKADGKAPGFPIVVFGGEHADVPLEESAGEVIAGAIVENGFSAILDLSLLRKAAQVRFMTDFAEALYRLNRKPLHFVVDEADAFAPQRPLPGEQRLLGAFEDIVRRGRARGLGVTLITQRAAVLNKNVLTQIEVLVCLRTISPQDREAVEAWIEVHGTKQQRDAMMAELPSLAIGTAYFWSPGWLDIFKRVEVRKKTTFDSSATPKVGQKITAPKELAPVDLDALGTQIQSTVERQKENDPRELKRQLATLRKELAALEKKQTPAAVEKVKEVPALTKEERKLLSELATAADDLDMELQEVADSITKLMGFAPAFRQLVAEKFSAGKSPIAVVRPTPTHFRPVLNEPRPVHRAPAAAAEAANGELGRAARAILTAAIQRHPKRSSRPQLALLSGYSVNSSSFSNALGELRSKGLLSGQGDDNGPTDAGIAALPGVPPLPGGEELQRHWLNQLGKAERGLLGVILDHPGGIDAENLSGLSGYSSNSSSFSNALGKLRTLELITRGWPAKPSEDLL